MNKKHAECWHNREIIFHLFGVIHSEHHEQENTPIQGVFSPPIGYVEVFSKFAEGIRDIESFTYLYLLQWFDRATDVCLLQNPPLTVRRSGASLPSGTSTARTRWDS